MIVSTVYPFFSYLKFLLTATNQHGVHSPFVYDLVTKCLYTKGNRELSVTEDVLVKSISYFSFKKIALVNDSKSLKAKLNAIFEALDYETAPFDIVYMDMPWEAPGNQKKENLHNDTLLLIAGIYRSKRHTAYWNMLKKKQHVRVTIDLFHCGMVFFRREQAKEHFKIRL